MAKLRIDVDEALVERVRKELGSATKWEAVEFALRRVLEKAELTRALRRLQEKRDQES